MLVYNVNFAITDGTLLATIRAGVSSWAPVTVQRKVPETKTARMVTLRNDSGPQDGIQSRRRYGCNVWAESPVVAEKLSNDAMAALRVSADGAPITALNGFSGPYEIEDEPPFTVAGVELAHFYFTFTAVVRGSAA